MQSFLEKRRILVHKPSRLPTHRLAALAVKNKVTALPKQMKKQESRAVVMS
ncbi:MAG: hypothetical protein ACOVQA_02140 [Thermoflexibacteraceae bacterium]|jgi:hypothetical protein